MGCAADFLIEETRRHIIESLSVQKQTSNYLSCFLWETPHPTTQADDSCELSGELRHSKEIHPYVSQQMHILFFSMENYMSLFKFIFLLLLLFFKNNNY